MNKFKTISKTISLAILGGIDTVVYIFTPIILGVLWYNVSGFENWKVGFLFSVGLIATIFRAIKIGWMK
jgi:hypothetical protein